jgi:arsenate reductase
MKSKKTLLFLCTGNSCRSQIAEALAKSILGDRFEVYSAGIEKHRLDEYAVKVMGEMGIDMSSHYSKTIEELGDIQADYVVTVCDNAQENCPYFPAQVKLMHRSFEDPPARAAGLETEGEKLEIYRKVRDQIKEYIGNQLLGEISDL